MKEIKELDYRSHRSFFNIIEKWPKICMIVIIILFCIWGIIDTAVIQMEEYVSGHGYVTYYGVMGLPNGFLNWFIWAVIGTACGLLTYVFTKLAICYKVLVIVNLEKISKITETLPLEPEKEKKPFEDN